MSAGEVDAYTPFIGQIYMGHLRYSTTGRSGLEYTHPFLRQKQLAFACADAVRQL